MSEQTALQGFQLSPQQQRIWLLQQEGRNQYLQCAVSIKGNLDKQRLNKALQAVIARHEILRTNFQKTPLLDFPLQVINDEIHIASVGAEAIDLTTLEGAAQEEAILHLTKKQQSHLFDLENSLPLHTLLVRQDQESAMLLIAIPALCADSTTLRYLLDETVRAYASTEEYDQAEEEALQYADFTEWQIETLEQEESPAARDFWQKQIQHIHRPDLQWLEHSSRKTTEQRPSCTLSTTLESHSVKELQELAARHDLSIEGILLSAWLLLLQRLSNTNDISIGVVAQGREVSEPQKLLGPVARNLPIHLKVGKQQNGLELCTYAEKALSEAKEWEVYCTPTHKHEKKSSLISTPVAFEYSEWPQYDVNGLKCTLINQHLSTNTGDLKLNCVNNQQKVQVNIEYDPTVYDGNSVTHLQENYQVLLRALLFDVTSPVSRLSCLSDSDIRFLQRQNTDRAEYPADKLVHQLFEEQVALHPQRLALVYENQQITYADLNWQANQLAHFLISHGAGPDTPIVLLTERSCEMILGLLAILKAGSAYVPLNPAHPGGFLQHHLSMLPAPVVLTQKKYRQQLQAYDGLILCLDDDRASIEKEPGSNPDRQMLPAHLAYIIYTSGSTGNRKGVQITHQSLLNYIYTLSTRLSFQQSKQHLQFAHVSAIDADLGNTSIFLALTSGGVLHIFSHEKTTDGILFAQYMSKQQIDVLKISPSHLSMLLHTTGKRDLLPSRWLLIGGEPLSFSLVEQIEQLESSCQIINHYGPTETTIGSVVCDLADLQQPYENVKTVPIGRPIENVELYILDQELQMVPVGVPGEMYIGGACLARGYLGQPDLTAERFVPDPFNKTRPARLYKTGDLGRYLPDGQIEFLRRADRQIKIYGFRVELNEIENALRGYPGTQEAAVIAREQSGDKQLIAYVTLNEDQLRDKAPASILLYLKKYLPDHMLPARIIPLEFLPLTANGKLDYQALPTPDHTPQTRERPFVAPRTPSEEVVTSQVAQLLNLQQVSITDNFFDLGGHSLLAMQLVARLREAFQVELPVRLLFDQPVVEDLSLAILEHMFEQGDEDMSALLQEVQQQE